MHLKYAHTLFGSIALTALTIPSTNAVLPAVATDNTIMDNSVSVPLISQIVPNPVQSVQSQPMQGSFSAIAPAISTNQGQLPTKITASVVGINPQGGEILAPITPQVTLNKGSVIEYHGYITNTTAERVKTLKTTLGIPTGTELQSVTSISPQPAYGSSDGIKFNYMPIKASINGTLQEMPMSYYKTLQWDIAGLGLNEVAEVKYRVVVK